jgi:uncharacterized integral membrane protein (TIGR00698 family)
LDAIKKNLPGTFGCITIALASTFVADHYGGPVMLFALLFGIGFHYLYEEENTRDGIDFCSGSVLRLGVALLGFRITTGEFMDIGLIPLLILLAAVTLTIFGGVAIARLLGMSGRLGLLAGCSVGICGASAALAVSSAMADYKEKQLDTTFVVVTVTALSTVAMILYPVFAATIGLSEAELGLFLGGTIHDVAQVVGAGYSFNDEVGDHATIIKLFRVALLVPVVIIISLMARKEQSSDGKKPALIPWFLVAFAVFVFINSTGVIPGIASEWLDNISRWFLVAAIAALGVKTSFKDLTSSGFKPVLLMLLCSAIVALAVLGFDKMLT